MRHSWRLASILLSMAAPLGAQVVPRTVTLQEAIALAQTQGLAAGSAELAREATRWQSRAFGARLLPQIKVSGGTPRFFRRIDQVTQPDGTVRFVGRSQTESSLTFTVDQSVPFTGGQLYFSSSLIRNEGNDTRFWASSPAVVGIRQELFRPNPFAWDTREQALTSQVAERRYIEQQEEIASQTTDAFFNALRARMSLQNAHVNAAINDTLYRFNQARYDAGKIAEDHLLQSQLALLRARAAVEDARLTDHRATATLQLHLGLPQETGLEIVPPTTIPAVKIDAKLAARSALQKSSATVQRSLQTVQAQRSVQETKARVGFNATVSAEIGYNQTASAFGDAYRSLLGQQQFAVEIQLPLVQWGLGKAQLEAARATQRQVENTVRLEEQQQEQEAYFVAYNLDRLREQVELAAKTDTVAARRFEVAKQRYLVGMIDNGNNLFTAQSEKDGARQAYIEALGAYWTAYQQLRRLTLYDFVADHALITAKDASKGTE